MRAEAGTRVGFGLPKSQNGWFLKWLRFTTHKPLGLSWRTSEGCRFQGYCLTRALPLSPLWASLPGLGSSSPKPPCISQNSWSTLSLGFPQHSGLFLAKATQTLSFEV